MPGPPGEPTNEEHKHLAHLVIIDDEESILDLLRFYFEDLGHKVTIFAEGSKALAFLGSQDADLVLTDIRMPGVSGLEVCRWIKTNKPALPVVTMSGFSDAEAELEKLGVHDRIKKPFGLREVSELVQARARKPSAA